MKRPNKTAPALATFGPLKVIRFTYPNRTVAFRVTGTVLGVRIQDNHPTLAEAQAAMERLFLEATHGLTPAQLNRPNLVRTWLSESELVSAEAAIQRLKDTKFNLLEVCTAGITALTDRAAVRANPREYLIQALKEMNFGRLPERRPGESESKFQQRLVANQAEVQLLAQANEAELAVVHFNRTQQIRGVQPRTAESYGYILRSFLSFADIKTLAEFTAGRVLGFLGRPKIASSTKKDQRVRLAEFGRHLVRLKLLATNPAADLGRIRVEARTIEFVSVATMRQTLEDFARRVPLRSEVGRFELLPPLLLHAFSGARPEEIDRLSPDWSNFNFEAGTVQIVRRKTGDPNETLQLHPLLVPVLQSLRTLGVHPANRPRRFWTPWLRDAGVKPRVRDILRHSFATHEYAINKNYHQLAHIMNNSTDILRKHYVNTSVDKETGEAYFALLKEVPAFIALPSYAPGQTGDASPVVNSANPQPD